MPKPPNRATSTPEPGYEVTYTCKICGKVTTYQRGPYGSLPTICPDCQSKAASERVKRWRLAHPDKAKAANKRTVAQRKARKAAESDGENKA